MNVQIRIEQFEGPLDLLLNLIEEQKLDITTVSLAKVTEQFLGYVKNLPAPTSPDGVGRGGPEKNPTQLADFLVISAKLLVIKSKALLPDLDFGSDDEEAAFDLTEQLLRYKKFKEVAKYFQLLELRRRQSWARDAELEPLTTFFPDPAITTRGLAACLGQLAEELKTIIRHERDVVLEVVSITDKIRHIQTLISDKLETSLSELLKNSKTKTEIVVTFLALLELIKQRVLVVEQSAQFEDITIKKISNV